MLIKRLYKKSPLTIDQDSSVGDSLKMLLQEGVNGLIILNKKQHIKGILSLQDIAAASVPEEFKDNINMSIALYKEGFFQEMCHSLSNIPVKKIMRTEFLSVTLEDNIMTVISDFLSNDLYIVPVTENKKLIGVITRTEIKQALARGMGILPELETS